MSTRRVMPLGDDALREVAVAARVCVRPLLRRLTDRESGETAVVAIPCGSTRESVCPSCSAKARALRAHQCAEGWHLTEDPLPPEHDERDDSDDVDAAVDDVDQAEDSGDDEGAADAGGTGERRCRSTRRRDDFPPLPKRPAEHTSIGQTFTGRDGRTYTPSMFLTLTLDSYGKVVPGRGVPVDPDTYDYRRAALDALLFPKLVDRFWQNLRRCAGRKVQYFAAVEPQRRLAPHLHAAVRGAIPRQIVRQVVAGTYEQVWWPDFTEVIYGEDNAPTWRSEAVEDDQDDADDADREADDQDRAGLVPHAGTVRAAGDYVDPLTGWALPTWDQAMDDLADELDADPAREPAHLLRFGAQVDLQGIIPGADATKAVRYLTKYLTKAVAHTYANPDAPDPAYEAHIDRLHEHVRWLPCSPRCANWLAYGIQPKDAGPGLTAGACPSKAHDRECLGLGGRRVLVSRHWTGKTLTEHRADRLDIVRATLLAAGVDPDDITNTNEYAADALADDGKPRWVWEEVAHGEDGYDYQAVIGAALARAQRWRRQYEAAKTVAAQRGSPPVDGHSATARAA